ncbi:pca operon transcription factor PcaQ [Rhodobacteraceae bacterium N5(2021)]|uniref:Pca operon transcription factor PcaQ n=1 Tax=Gymnodinialimonas phycosphaerae TaxID=2841589 RepID=A0A975TTY0_9RHOB|nr:pca operon transcription factor PcaQ [Gymnodinialimonas phycosphaerae]MBY4894033.1 pca operon transcription factor PcaQ [Gymnodinialimonas phycosphaerae]
MDRRIKFRHLDAFSAIARAGSLKRAAEQLNLTQPAISKTLRELEDIAGARLMERSRAGVRLTPAGDVFLQFAEQSTTALRHGLRSVRGGGEMSGHLRIGALPSVAGTLVPRAVRRFTASAPDTLVEVQEGQHHDLTALLRSGTLDLVVGRLGRPDSMVGLTFRQLYTEPVIVVTAPGSAAVSVASLDELAGCRVLYPPQQSAIRPLVARAMIAAGQPLYETRIETTSAAVARAILAEDPTTVWFISQGVVQPDLDAGRLVALDVPLAQTAGAVGVMRRADDMATSSARTFIQVLAED